MIIQKNLSKIGFVLTVMIVLFTLGCTGVGIFAVVAVSEKIDAGLLPEGISGRPVVHINPADGTEDYYFFASGPGIWAKNHVTNGLWRPISLSSGGTDWDGVQSMAVAGNRIFLALYDVNGDNYKVAIHTLDSYTVTPFCTPITGAEWALDPAADGYTTIRLFAPDSTGDVYVNVMSHSGVYASLDEEDQGFTGSDLYTLPNAAINWTSAVAIGDQTQLDGTNGTRYVTSIASNGTQIRIAATNHMFNSSGGILLDENGALVTNPDGNPAGSISLAAGDYTNTSSTGITWLSGPGQFIMASTALDNDTLPIFVSTDGTGNAWSRVGGTSTDFLTTNFIDVSGETAGLSDGKQLVLAGTSSYIDGSTSHYGSGYNEIDVTNAPSTWTVNTSWDSYSFALNTNYSVSDLAEATITGMSIPAGGSYLYASTRSEGIWKIDLSTDKPSWTRE